MIPGPYIFAVLRPSLNALIRLPLSVIGPDLHADHPKRKSSYEKTLKGKNFFLSRYGSKRVDALCLFQCDERPGL